MNHKIKWLVGLLITLIFISACGLLDTLNPIDEVTKNIDDLADQLPMEDIQGEIEGLITELPGELETLATDIPENLDNITDDLQTLTTDLPDDLETLATDLPSEIDDITGDLGGIFDDVIGSDEIPPDIPVVEEDKNDLFGSEKIVSYTTSLDFDSVLNFYQDQMPENGWTTKEGSVITADAALLYFEKADREATVTLSFSPSDNTTVVMIIVQQK